MYNGVGVGTARGTGTSGYVERSLSNIKHMPSVLRDWKVQKKATFRRPPEETDPWLARHKLLRDIELKLFLRRNELISSGISESVIDSEISSERERLRSEISDVTMSSGEISRAIHEAKTAVAFGVRDR